jgi:hypothetical protein
MSDDARRARARAQKLGFAVRFKDWAVQNIVATGDVGFPIRLEGMADEHSMWTSVRLGAPARARARVWYVESMMGCRAV